MAASFLPVYGLNVFTTAPTAANAGVIQIDNSAAAALAAMLGIDFTYASLSDGVNYEIVLIQSVTSQNLNVVRGQDGTESFAFPGGSCLRFVWTSQGIAAVAAGGGITIGGTGSVQVTETAPGVWDVFSAIPSIDGTSPIVVLGEYPSWEISSQASAGGCCCGGGSGGGGTTPITITGTGLAVVTGASPAFNVAVASPHFIGAAGVTVTGVWPNITITGSGIPPAPGVETVTGSAKVIIAGTAFNPVIQLATTAPGAQTYNGVTFDAYGTITAVNGAYQPITSITSANANLVISGTATTPILTVTVPSVVPATTGVQGIVLLAAPTAVASTNPADTTSAVVPAGLAAALTVLPATEFNAASSYTPAAAGTYTNILAGANITLNLTGTESALVSASASASDSATVVPPQWGLAVFNGGSLYEGIIPIWTGQHVLQFEITAPFAGTLSLKTTALTGTTTVVGQSLNAVITPK